MHTRLDAARPVRLATVTTVPVRLWRKGRLERRKTGRSYTYHVRQSPVHFVAERMDEILATAGDRPSQPHFTRW